MPVALDYRGGYCPCCHEDMSWSSHYHCPQCGRECGVQGHVGGSRYACEEHGELCPENEEGEEYAPER
jgi:predicted amidophosphoribosyltransferase